MKLFYSLLVFASIAMPSLAQTPEKDIELIKEKYTAEGYYFHFDKDIYIAGETIWFKGYLTEAGFPNVTSTALNVELLNDSGRTLQKKILPVFGSAAIGEFDLPLQLPQGNYSIRAYTQRQLNFGPSFFHSQQIQVINPFNSNTAPEVIQPKIFFLPESGNMVDGIPSVLAFKAGDQYGRPLEINGQITDEQNVPVIEFTAEHWGMGKVVFIPSAGKKYFATFEFENKSYKEPLPAVSASGATFNIQLAEKKSRFIVNRLKVANAMMQPAYVLGIVNDEVVFKIDIPVSASKIIMGDLPVENIPSGILQLTLFTATHQPLCERMLFVNNNDYQIPGSFKADTVSFKALQKNKFTLAVNDTSAGTYSVSVVDIGSDLPSQNRENIVSRLFLQNNINGYVHNPLYYFAAPYSFAKQQHLDLVMLTSGWRRYNWEQVTNKSLPQIFYKDLNYISFGAKAFEKNGKTPMPNTFIAAQLASKDSSNEYLKFLSDSAAMINLRGVVFTDTATFYFETATEKKKDLVLHPQLRNISEYFRYQQNSNNRMTPVISRDNSLTTLAVKHFNTLKEVQENFVMMQNLTLTNAKKINKAKIIEDRYASGLFNQGYGKVYDFINNPIKIHYRNVFEYLKVNGTSINVSGSGFDYAVNFRMTRSLLGGLIPASLYLDGFSVAADVLAGIPMQDVAMVKTFTAGFAGAEGGGAGGAVAVFTKKGNDRTSRNLDKKVELKVEGFSPAKDFFSPDYSIAPPTKVDKRSTIYWNPYLTFNSKNPELVIPFYNDEDGATGFKVIITGINAEGKLLYVEQLIK